MWVIFSTHDYISCCILYHSGLQWTRNIKSHISWTLASDYRDFNSDYLYYLVNIFRDIIAYIVCWFHRICLEGFVSLIVFCCSSSLMMGICVMWINLCWLFFTSLYWIIQAKYLSNWRASIKDICKISQV